MILSQRSTQPEQMDTDCADFDDYARCLRDLSRVNVVTLTHRAMLGWLAKQAKDRPDFTLLDIACGHGDALRRIRRKFPTATLTGIDLNPWAKRAAEAATDPADGITFITDDAFAYKPGKPFDFIICSQFTHHLTDEQVVEFLVWLRANAGRGWFIGDVQRSVFAYYGFPVLARIMFWHRFIREDGQISVARSFVRADWEAYMHKAGITPEQAEIVWYFPFRLCVASR
nr:methyltransferase domain-containing protein [uncultured Rhodopila sp.]